MIIETKHEVFVRSNGVKNRTHQDNLFIVVYLYLKFIYLIHI